MQGGSWRNTPCLLSPPTPSSPARGPGTRALENLGDSVHEGQPGPSSVMEGGEWSSDQLILLQENGARENGHVPGLG